MVNLLNKELFFICGRNSPSFGFLGSFYATRLARLKSPLSNRGYRLRKSLAFARTMSPVSSIRKRREQKQIMIMETTMEDARYVDTIRKIKKLNSSFYTSIGSCYLGLPRNTQTRVTVKRCLPDTRSGIG